MKTHSDLLHEAGIKISGDYGHLRSVLLVCMCVLSSCSLQWFEVFSVSHSQQRLLLATLLSIIRSEDTLN